jgi:hypothetical protein
MYGNKIASILYNQVNRKWMAHLEPKGLTLKCHGRKIVPKCLDGGADQFQFSAIEI